MSIITGHTAIIKQGSSFGEWTVVDVDSVRRGSTYWQCECSCGVARAVRGTELRAGRSLGCGHDGVKARVSAITTHGQYGTPTYWSWVAMKARCNNPRLRSYKDYGGRGITVCERWNVFENFYSDMGDKPSRRHSLERIDNNQGYSPENCMWALPIQQMNNRRANRFLIRDGKRQTVAMWCRELRQTREAVMKGLALGYFKEETKC